MALLDDVLKGNIATGLAIGIGAAILAPVGGRGGLLQDRPLCGSK